MSEMDDLIRGAAGHRPDAEREPPRTTSFDGGARGLPPSPAPSMDGLLRAARDGRHDLYERAADFDHERQ